MSTTTAARFEIVTTNKSSEISSFGTVKTEKAFIAFAKKETRSANFYKKGFEIARLVNAISSLETAKSEMCKLFNLDSIELVSLAKGQDSLFNKSHKDIFAVTA